MNLADADILELTTLCSALVDGTISEKQKVSLSDWLANSEPAREFYVRFMGQSASLHYYAGEMQTDAAETGLVGHPAARRFKWAIGMLGLAASIAIAVWIGRAESRQMSAPPSATVATAVAEDEFVGRLTGSKQCVWSDDSSTVQPGGRLRKGQRLELAKGFAEVTFDSGALVVLQGPASLDLNSEWSATLNRGTLKANIPPEAQGFSILNPHVEVVDIGTEFTMFADSAGSSAEVLVLKGEVYAQPRVPGDQERVVMGEKEARRFGASGVSTVHNGEAKFTELTQPVQLDRYSTQVGYAHWSFDETTGNQFHVETSDLDVSASDIQVQRSTKSTPSLFHSDGRWNGAMHFDGTRYARAALPGISENLPHTVSFWVKVPSDAILSTAYAMVAWGADTKKFGTHPFHIGWNRNPNEGLIGVLRTDYGRGFAVGMTPIRDGRWHHVAVVLIPRDDKDSPMEVKQYVDGRLDGESKPSPSGSDIFYSSENDGNTTSGMIWLGCRLGTKGVRVDRFYGDIDELFIADRALEPQQIVHLMTYNRLDDRLDD
jgi:ferric-dicitrate binding protein FerR (iron transport regulator)